MSAVMSVWQSVLKQIFEKSREIAVRRAHRSAKASATNGDGTFFSTQEVSDTVDPRLSLKIHPKAAMLDSFFQAASE